MDIMNKISTCCSDLIIKDKIRISPILINNDLNINIIDLLKNKYENKCCKYGYVLKVYNLKIDNEIPIEMEDNTCDNMIKIEFTILTCLPVINDKIVIKILKMENALMVGINGPMMCILKE
jgi:DNA-directed RNA polymerase subunit E'/Rpb7